MIRVQTNVVLKYCEPVDEFVRFRVFTSEEAQKLLAESRIVDKRGYVALVLNACVLNYSDQVLPRLKQKAERLDAHGLEDRIFSLCVELNPCFDLRKVTIPVATPEAADIHLLQSTAKKEEKRDFRNLKDMETDLGNRIIGQKEAVEGVARVMRKALTGLRDHQRPIASLFFVGQTGVGKTELARALTTYLYHDTQAMLRIDCSEYAMPHEYAKLLGSPPGYIGHDEGGILAEAHRRTTPVLLFDEVEKSDPKVHHLLLQLMDDGTVSDNRGRKLDFHNAIVILTSNLGGTEIAELRQRAGFRSRTDSPVQPEAEREEALSAVRHFFAPEFVNRLTDIVVFNPLALTDCEKIAERFLDGVREHASSVPLDVNIERGVARFLAEKAYRPEYGAREVRRTVEREVESPLSDLLVEGRVHEGDHVSVRIRRSKVDFRKN